ncbi:hypothetical protein ABIE44_002764 [Marmoricola sp. OAE513]|uniref:hypothetical protein n=1 Tax=Marmoricola sp. OAE513 TaxID=2817894 RepID=UPI001AE761C6
MSGDSRETAADLNELCSMGGWEDGEDEIAWDLFTDTPWPAWFPAQVSVFEDGDVLMLGISLRADAPGRWEGIAAIGVEYPTTPEEVVATFAEHAEATVAHHLSEVSLGGVVLAVPSVYDGEFEDLLDFADSYDARRQVSDDFEMLEAVALAPVLAAYRVDDAGAVGVDVLRAALWCLGRTERAKPAPEAVHVVIEDLSPRDPELAERNRLWDWILDALREKSGNVVPWLGPPIEPWKAA